MEGLRSRPRKAIGAAFGLQEHIHLEDPGRTVFVDDPGPVYEPIGHRVGRPGRTCGTLWSMGADPVWSRRPSCAWCARRPIGACCSLWSGCTRRSGRSRRAGCPRGTRRSHNRLHQTRQKPQRGRACHPEARRVLPQRSARRASNPWTTRWQRQGDSRHHEGSQMPDASGKRYTLGTVDGYASHQASRGPQVAPARRSITHLLTDSLVKGLNAKYWSASPCRTRPTSRSTRRAKKRRGR